MLPEVELGRCWVEVLEFRRCSGSNQEEQSWSGARLRLWVVTGEDDYCAVVPTGYG